LPDLSAADGRAHILRKRRAKGRRKEAKDRGFICGPRNFLRYYMHWEALLKLFSSKYRSVDGGVMKRMRPLVIFAFTAWLILLLLSGCSSEAGPGKPAPDFLLDDLSGSKISLKELNGHVVIIDFWATWCPPCLMTIPELVDLQKKYKDRGLSVVGISVDDPQKVTNRDLAAFRDAKNINYPIVRADAKVLEDYFANDSRMAIPTMFLVDRQGKIAEKKVGFVPGSLEKSVKKLL
jgi:thiol-disulfide isomerase/thioredoxin